MCRYPTDADIQYHLHMFESILKGIAQKVSKAVDRVPELLVECDYINYALRRGVGPFPLERMTLRGVPPATPKKKKKSTKRSKSSDLKRPTQATTLFDICIERVQHNLYIYLTLFTLYGYTLRPRKENQSREVIIEKATRHLLTTFVLWLSLDLQDKLESYLKFHTAYLFSESQLQAELPVSSWSNFGQNGIFMCGSFTKFIRMKKLKHHRELVFFWSLLQAKRGCKPLKVANVAEACVKHATRMVRLRSTPEDVLIAVSQTGSIIGRAATHKVDIDFYVPAPSTRACYENSIGKGGARSFIIDNLRSLVQDEDWYRSMDVLQVTMKTPHKDSDLPFSFEEGENEESTLTVSVDYERDTPDPVIVFNAIQEVLFKTKLNRTPPLVITGNPEHDIEKYNTENFGGDDSRDSIYIYYPEVFPVRQLANSYAEVVAIPEPFKTRIITKSEALLNYYGKPMQKILHRAIKKQRWGFAIGRPIVVEDVQKRFSYLKPGWKVVSGDYDGATDEMNVDMTRFSFDAVMSYFGISNSAKEILWKSLGEQILIYEETLNAYKNEPGYAEAVQLVRDLGEVTQTNGQLMGSILSFIFLCINNAGAFLASVRRWGELFPEEYEELFGDIPTEWLTIDDVESVFELVINGDDILFKGPQSLIDIWLMVTESGGLIPSIGKNYQSREFFTVNSMLFRRDDVTGKIDYEPYVNMSLVFGNDPDLGASYSTEPSLFAIAASGIQAKFLEGHDPDFQIPLNTFWLSQNAKYLKQCDLGRNWFIPKQLGGLGLRTDRKVSVTYLGLDYVVSDYKINQKQARVASFLATRATPEQVFKFTMEMACKTLMQSQNLSSEIVNNVFDGITERFSWVFGGVDPDNLLIEIFKLDPFHEKWEYFVSKEEKQKRIKYLKGHDQRIKNKLKQMCNGAGRLSPMGLVAIQLFERLPPGLPHGLHVTSSLEKAAYES